MKKALFLILVIGFITCSCTTQKKISVFNIETEKWQKELLSTNKVGKPCREDNNWDKWQEDNPLAYFGLQEIQSIESDFNSDGIKDALFYFPAINCVGGNGIGSDFGMLVYSYEGQFLTDKNITQSIEKRIINELAKFHITDINRIIIRYKGFGKTIVGEYFAWSRYDASCCPSHIGFFEYDPNKLINKIRIIRNNDN